MLEFYTGAKSAICPYTRHCSGFQTQLYLRSHPWSSLKISSPTSDRRKSEFIRMDPEASVFKAGIVLCVQDYGSIL